VIMNILVGAENTQFQGDINAIQVHGNVYNAPAEVTNIATQNNYHGVPLKGAVVGIRFYSPFLT